MATNNPYADETGNPKPGKTLQWVEWVEANGDDTLSDLSESDRQAELAYRDKLQDRMASEGFPVS